VCEIQLVNIAISLTGQKDVSNRGTGVPAFGIDGITMLAEYYQD
jgi:hypothetical protein